MAQGRMALDGSATCEIHEPASQVSATYAKMPGFDELYEEYADFVWRNARQLGVPTAALDDIVQDVFLVVHRKHGSLTSSSHLRAWMYGIVIRVVREHRRTQRRKEPHLGRAANAAEPDALADSREPSPFAVAAKSDALRVLHAILDEFDDGKREVFVLSELEEMTEVQIGEILGENVNTVHSRLRAARKDFERAVARHHSRDNWRLR